MRSFAKRETAVKVPTYLAYEMVDAVEANQAYHDEIEGDDVIQQARDDQDQNAGDKGDDGCDVINGDNHFKSPEKMRMIEPATIDTPHSCTGAACAATALGGCYGRTRLGPVCTDNSDSSVLVVETADQRMRYDAPDWLYNTARKRAQDSPGGYPPAVEAAVRPGVF